MNWGSCERSKESDRRMLYGKSWVEEYQHGLGSPLNIRTRHSRTGNGRGKGGSGGGRWPARSERDRGEWSSSVNDSRRFIVSKPATIVLGEMSPEFRILSR